MCLDKVFINERLSLLLLIPSHFGLDLNNILIILLECNIIEAGRLIELGKSLNL